MLTQRIGSINSGPQYSSGGIEVYYERGIHQLQPLDGLKMGQFMAKFLSETPSCKLRISVTTWLKSIKNGGFNGKTIGKP